MATEVHGAWWTELSSDMPLTLGEASLHQTFSHTSISPRGHYILYLIVQNTEALRSEVTCPGPQKKMVELFHKPGSSVSNASFFPKYDPLLMRTADDGAGTKNSAGALPGLPLIYMALLHLME